MEGVRRSKSNPYGRRVAEEASEGLAAGLPMVISAEANEGINASEGKAVKIGRTSEEFAAQVLALLENKAEAKAMAAEGLAFVQSLWSWEHNFRSLEEHLDKLRA